MSATMTDEYRQLGYDTSNDMIRADTRRGVGEYARAALHLRNAGFGRLRMGQMMFDAQDFAQAAADWLSAAACFDLATDPKQMREALDRVRQLDAEGKIPPARRDLHEGIKEREGQLEALEQKVLQFRQEYASVGGPLDSADQEILAWLLRQIRGLPGLPELHTAIASLAGPLGQAELAATHSKWAEQIDSGSQRPGALHIEV